MFNFHKPRVYRSADGCCICRAKSSSSRFTASRKYEKESMQCFNLQEPRIGEICNACVLLVKRYKRLPVGSKRHWGHVVDARAGPGTKSLAKQKKRESECEAKAAAGGAAGNGNGSFIPEKFAKIFKKSRKGKITAVAAPSAVSQQQPLHQQRSSSSHESSPQLSDSNESNDDEQQQQQQNQPQQQQQQLITCTVVTPYQTRKRTAAAAQLASTASEKSVGQRQRLTGSKRRRILEPMKHRRAVDNVPFFEADDLLRLDVCCGTVFQSLSLGSSSFIIDLDLYKPCEKHRRPRRQQQQQQQQLQQQQQPQQQQVVKQLQVEDVVAKPKLSTPALKKHHLYFKRQSESFPQGEIHRISPIPLNKTEAMPNTTPTPTSATAATTTTVQQQQKQHSTAKKPAITTATNALHPSILTTAVGAASPSSLSSSSNCSTSSSVATKFNDNSSDSGFEEHVLDRKSHSPPTQDELQLEKKPRGGGVQRLILANGLPISGQAQNLVLTGNEFTARFVQRQQATAALKINVAAAATTTAAAAATAATATATGSQSSGNKMRAIFNNANTIQHENGVTTILPASSLAATNQTAAMNAIAPSTVTIIPAIQASALAAATATATARYNTNSQLILLKRPLAKFANNNNNNSNTNNNQTPAEVKIA